MSEANSLLLHYKHYATTYNGNIKDINTHSFDMDEEVKEKNNKNRAADKKEAACEKERAKLARRETRTMEAPSILLRLSSRQPGVSTEEI